MPKAPMIPALYRKYRVRGGEPWRIDKDLYERDFEVMAPNRKRAEKYFKSHYPNAELYDVYDSYGPFLPSEERMMNPPGYDEMMRRCLDYERRKVRGLYDRHGMYGEGIDEDDIDKYLEKVARRNFRRDVNDEYERLPVVPQQEFSYVTPGGRFYRYNAFGPEGVRDRARMRGVDEDDIGMVEIPPFTNIPRGF